MFTLGRIEWSRWKRIKQAILYSATFRVKFGSHLKFYYGVWWIKPSPWQKNPRWHSKYFIKSPTNEPEDLIKVMLKGVTMNNRFQGHWNCLLLEEYDTRGLCIKLSAIFLRTGCLSSHWMLTVIFCRKVLKWIIIVLGLFAWALQIKGERLLGYQNVLYTMIAEYLKSHIEVYWSEKELLSKYHFLLTIETQSLRSSAEMYMNNYFVCANIYCKIMNQRMLLSFESSSWRNKFHKGPASMDSDFSNESKHSKAF